MDNSHIHHLGDGRGLRDIFVDGHKIDRPVYADTKKGFVYFHPLPYRLALKNKLPVVRELRGAIEVNFRKVI